MLKKRGQKQSQPQITIENPTSAVEFVQRGWDHYSKKEFFRAEADFRKALELSPGQPDYQYALAMSLQASGRSPESIKAFEESIQMMNNPTEEDHVRFLMMTRLAKGHISRMKTGQWKINTE